MEMQEHLTLSMVPETLDRGSEEERATFGAFVLEANGRRLTEGVGVDENALRPGPYVSGYHVAQWLAWNWWRLRWESRPVGEAGREWDFAHRLSSIGEGYVWPNVEISSDGFRSRLTSAPTVGPEAALFRYLGAPRTEVVSADVLEQSMDRFIESVLELLNERNVRDTNLHRLWQDIKHAREDEALSRFRRFEARLGHDPDEIDENAILTSLADAARLGQDALEELAAHPWQGTGVPSAAEVEETSRLHGFDSRPQDAVRLHSRNGIPAWGACEGWKVGVTAMEGRASYHTQNRGLGSCAAWKVGVTAARALRHQESLNGETLENPRLADLAGTMEAAIGDPRPTKSISFTFDDGNGGSRLALRSKWETGRRFDLARLVGDRLCMDGKEPLLPATQSSTYRQKVQRAFAAELLCPFEAVDAFLGGDLSEERCNDAAEHFKVSPLTIRTLLVNNGRIERDTIIDALDRI